MNLLIITGMSGAGKSLCVKYFEDIGYFCVDNLPPSLILSLPEVIIQSKNPLDKIALIVDIRGGIMFWIYFPPCSNFRRWESHIRFFSLMPPIRFW